MLNLLWSIPFFPLAGFLILVAGRMPRVWVPWIGAGSVGAAALLAGLVGAEFLGNVTEQPVFRQTLWHWMRVGEFDLPFAFYLDALSLNMLFVVTGVGFLIHVYSAGYMADDPGFARFFAYMNLFVFAMLILVLADNLPLLYLGWEGVGLCSYLLIGFWYARPENDRAARKAFIVTRAGDTALALGLFLLYSRLGTLDIQSAMSAVQSQPGADWVVVAALLLLGGAVGKSAQLPLQVWLPDAMAGPTPISALIHAATMVTAGVYLIARTHGLFQSAPEVQLLVAAVGALTLLMSGCTALTQTDIKRVLAWSTVSQIGYMFLALGVGAWSAAIFHLMTHAFFKALLFLAAGAVILSLHHEQDIFRMGGLWKKLPLAFACFIAGTAALVALPFTSGYYSKHEILAGALAMPDAGLWLGGAGVLGALLTALYCGRLILLVFFGAEKTHAHAHEALPLSIRLPLGLLAGLALAGGALELPLDSVFPVGEDHAPGTLAGLAMNLAPWLGLAVAYMFYGSRRGSADAVARHPLVSPLFRFWQQGWGFDRLYDALLVRPYGYLAAINRHDVVDDFYRMIVLCCRSGHGLVARTQTGQLRWYACGIGCGVVLLIALGAGL